VRSTIRKFAIAGFGAPRDRSKIAGFERLRSAALRSKAMVDLARRIRITTALSPKDGQLDLAGFIRGRGGKMVQLCD
jgi:hypothetical protein